MALHIINHPMIQHKLTIMRKKETGTREFRELLKEIGMLMGYEITRDFPLKNVEIETPMQRMIAHEQHEQQRCQRISVRELVGLLLAANNFGRNVTALALNARIFAVPHDVVVVAD